MKRKFPKFRTVFLLLGVFTFSTVPLVFSCGGGGSSSSSSGGGSSGSGGSCGGSPVCGDHTKTYYAFTKGTSSQEGIYLVDPDNPTSQPITITDKSINDTLISDFQYDPTTGTTSDIHTKLLLYVENDSKTLKKISLVKNGNNTLSPETVDTGLCEFEGQTIILHNPKKWVDIYVKPDVNGRCPKDYINIEPTDPKARYKYGDLYIIGTDFPRPVKIGKRNIVTALFSGASPSAKEEKFLVAEGTNKWAADMWGMPHGDDNYTFYICPLNDILNNCTQILGNVTDYTGAGWHEGNPYLCVKTSSGQSLYEFYKDSSGNYTAKNLNVACGVNWAYDYDGEAIYALEPVGIWPAPPGLQPKRLKKYKFGSNATQFENLSNSTFLNQELTTRQGENYFILNKYDNATNSTQLVAVKKSDGSEIVLDDHLSGPYLPFVAPPPSLDRKTKTVVWTRLIDTDNDTKPDRAEACSWKEGDATPTCKHNSYWALGMVYKTSYKFPSETHPGVWTLLGLDVCRALRVDGFKSGFLGGTLKAVNLSDMSETTVGNIPDGYTLPMGIGLGDKFLLRMSYSNATGPGDIFYLDLVQKKLEQLTHSTEDEVPLTP